MIDITRVYGVGTKTFISGFLAQFESLPEQREITPGRMVRKNPTNNGRRDGQVHGDNLEIIKTMEKILSSLHQGETVRVISHRC